MLNSTANAFVECQLGPNYIGADGGLKSNVEVGDVVNTITHEYSWSSGSSGVTPDVLRTDAVCQS